MRILHNLYPGMLPRLTVTCETVQWLGYNEANGSTSTLTYMTMRTKYLLAIPAVLLLAILLLYLRLTDITAFLVKRELRAAGFTDISLDIQALTTTQGSITTLRARHPAINLHADGITLHYTLAQLLDTRIDTIEITSLRLSLHTPHGEPGTIALPVLPADLLAALPFNRALITQARLELPDTIQTIPHLDLQADIKRNDNTLDAQVILTSDARPPLLLQLTANTENAIALTMKDRISATPVFTLRCDGLAVTPDTLRTALTLDTDLRTMRSLIAHWLPEVTLPAMLNAIHAAGTLALSVASQKQQADLELTGVTLALPDNIIRLERVTTQLQASPDELSASANILAAGGKVALGIKAHHDTRKQHGNAGLTLQPVSLDAKHNIPGKLLHRWPYPVHIEGGTLTGTSNIHWQQKNGRLVLDQSSRLMLDNIAGRIRQIPFSGLRGSLTIRGIDPLRITSRDGLRLASIDPGVVITDMHVQANVSRRPGKAFVTRLKQFKASTLGGTLSADNTLIDLNRNTNQVILNVQGLDIAELIKLEQKKGLNGTGKLNGTLPIMLGKDGLRMSAGILTAQPPYGVIQYRGDERLTALANNNQNVGILVKALSDFHYHLLEARLDYAPDGQLLAKVRLQGKNPELEGGRPVHLNISLEENVLTLLRSLQFADEISRKIGEGIEQGTKRP